MRKREHSGLLKIQRKVPRGTYPRVQPSYITRLCLALQVSHPKSDEQRQRLQEACRDILLFKNLDPVSTQDAAPLSQLSTASLPYFLMFD